MSIEIYRKKPIEVPAVRFNGHNWDAVRELTGEDGFAPVTHDAEFDDPTITAKVWDRLHSTWVGVKPGHYILEGTSGEHYPIDPTVLATTYDRVDGS